MIVKHAERQREWTGGDDNKRHSDVIARERVRFGLRCYWRRRPSRGEMSPPSNRSGFRPDAATTPHGPRLRDKQTGLDWSVPASDLIGPPRCAYHLFLQRNNGRPARYG